MDHLDPSGPVGWIWMTSLQCVPLHVYNPAKAYTSHPSRVCVLGNLSPFLLTRLFCVHVSQRCEPIWTTIPLSKANFVSRMDGLPIFSRSLSLCRFPKQ